MSRKTRLHPILVCVCVCACVCVCVGWFSWTLMSCTPSPRCFLWQGAAPRRYLSVELRQGGSGWGWWLREKSSYVFMWRSKEGWWGYFLIWVMRGNHKDISGYVMSLPRRIDSRGFEWLWLRGLQMKTWWVSWHFQSRVGAQVWVRAERSVQYLHISLWSWRPCSVSLQACRWRTPCPPTPGRDEDKWGWAVSRGIAAQSAMQEGRFNAGHTALHPPVWPGVRRMSPPPRRTAWLARRPSSMACRHPWAWQPWIWAV